MLILEVCHLENLRSQPCLSLLEGWFFIAIDNRLLKDLV